MKDKCILCDFDGTITKNDGLYNFFSSFAKVNWFEIEQLWENNKIDSKECLLREFQSVENLNERLINNYLETIKIDPYFKEFYNFTLKNNYDFLIVSDGVDYFINKVLKNNNINDIKIISNHFEIKDGIFKLSFPFENQQCKKNAGTCKCKILYDMKKQYDKIIYIGDGTSDFCVCNKADILFAKGKLIEFCKANNIVCNKFDNFSDILEQICNIL